MKIDLEIEDLELTDDGDTFLITLPDTLSLEDVVTPKNETAND